MQKLSLPVYRIPRVRVLLICLGARRHTPLQGGSTSVCAIAVCVAVDHSPESRVPCFLLLPSIKTEVEERRGSLITNWDHRPKERGGERFLECVSAQHVLA